MNGRFAGVMIVVVLAAIVGLGVFLVGSNFGSGPAEASVEATQMIQRLPNGPPSLIFADLKSMRSEPSLEPFYDALQRDVDFWIKPVDMTFGEVDRMAVGDSVAVVAGLFDLDQLRCKLRANEFTRTEYREVEFWVNDSGVITCDDCGLFSCDLSNNPCMPWNREEEEEREPYSGQIGAVALMSTGGFASRGYEMVISGSVDAVRDCIGVIKYGDASIYDDPLFKPMVDKLPTGLVIKCQKDKLLDRYTYDGLEVSGISIAKHDTSTLTLEGFCQFEDRDSAEASLDSIRNDLQNSSDPTWRGVEVTQQGSTVKVMAEADIEPLALVDLAPPLIRDVMAHSITTGAAMITWTTDVPAASGVEYGEDRLYGHRSEVDDRLSTRHAVILTGLEVETEYHYRVVSSDAAGLIGVSLDHAFRTLKEFPCSYEVIDDNGQAALRVHIAPTIFVEIGLKNPDGVLVDSRSVEPGTTSVILHMARPYINPQGGTYTLIASDSVGQEITVSTFHFSGPEASVTGLYLDWKYVGYAGAYNLYGISFNVKNDGDLPLYVYRTQATLGATVLNTDISLVLLPGEGQRVHHPMYMTGLRGGSERFVLLLKDRAGTVSLTYSTTITPP